MSGAEGFAELMNRSSLGSPTARSFCARTPAQSAERVRRIAGLEALEDYVSADPQGSLARQLAGATMRQLREDAGLPGADVAHRMGWSSAKFHRFERGMTRVSEPDITVLLELYEADERFADLMVRLVRKAAEPGWWEEKYSRLVPEWLGHLISLQEGADCIRSFESLRVPSLLQTADYAESLLQVGHPVLNRKESARRTELLMERQARLSGRRAHCLTTAPLVWALIDESALYREVGGRDVMREQLQHLLGKTESPDGLKVALRIVPMRSSAASAAGVSAFSFLRFALEVVPDTIFVRNPSSAQLITGERETDSWRMLLDRLAVDALSIDETRRLLAEAIRALR
ncbi:XRE family transcriptional regulator [Streptomyces inhibens]|uniref:XRE family transcriptional regulator n=1 Tax=Streptomyces inhibens TaxID=2293571 RepID=A0A371Q4L9_STRIH|nr:helix-turn-helix transcriptional regulator [Streptomyces inhibens]REK89621.1 XRE family transcriptional regulator [Streptomyces inhibens]